MLFVLLVLTTVAAFAGGLYIGTKSNRLKVMCAAPALALAVAFAVVRHALRLESSFADSGVFAALHDFWGVPFAIFVVGVGVVRMRSVILRDAALVAAGAVAFLQLQGVFWCSFISYDHLRGVINQYGYCPQTTGYTCTPAAATTLLHHFGISTTEKEMAILSRTSRQGTSLIGVCYAINVKTRAIGLRAVADNLSWDDLLEAPKPCLVRVDLFHVIPHTVTLLEAKGDEVSLVDPLVGRQEMTRERFLDEYAGEAVVLVPR